MTHPIPHRIAKYLGNALQNNRLGHALLFAGPHNAQKELAAIHLAAGLLCSNQKAPVTLGGCTQCISCQQVLKKQHVFLRLIMSDAERLRRELVPENSSSPSEEIRIDAIRQLNHEQRMCSPDHDRRIWVIIDGHRLTQQAANALLKTLEEPHNSQFLIILAPTIRSVLPTIASRCQRIIFPSINGLDMDVTEQKENTLFLQIQSGNVLTRLHIIEQLTKNREDLLPVLLGLQTYAMENLKRMVGDNKESFFSLKRAQMMRQIVQAIEKTRVDITNHLNTQLVIEELLLKSWPYATETIT